VYLTLPKFNLENSYIAFFMHILVLVLGALFVGLHVCLFSKWQILFHFM